MSDLSAVASGAGGQARPWWTVRQLLPYLWPAGQRGVRVRVVIAMAMLGLTQASNTLVPWLLGQATDALSNTGSAQAALLAVPAGTILAYALARLVGSGGQSVRDMVFARVAQRALRSVALQVFRHLHQLSLRFHLNRQTGGLSRAIERGTTGIETLLSFMLFNILPTLLEVTLVAMVLWWLLDIWFALVTLVTVAIYIGLTMAITEWRLKFRRRMNDTDSRANTAAIDSLINFETVKYFANEEHEAERYGRAMRAYEDAAVTSQASLAVLNLAQGAVISVGLAAVLFMAARGVVAGTMTAGDFVMVNTYLLQLYRPLNFFGFAYRQVKTALADMETMFALLDEEPDVKDKPDAQPLAIDRGEVTFDHVSFGYDPRRPILQDVSFTIPPGHTLAVVGPTGAGKSTLSRLLFRFYDVDAGAVRIDGQDVRDVTQASLRAAIGIVPQDTVLFNDTIYYNIAYGRPSAGEEEVYEAARLAQIHDFVIGLPDGYDSRVGERGLKLSGGEKQRVAIARTILKNPSLLVFDEATSALDTHTEREIQDNLAVVARGRTTLVIAHRLSTIVEADQIIVLDQGRVLERGQHRDLLAVGGAYAQMWARQQSATDSVAAE